MRTICKEIFKFEELTESGQQAAIKKLWDINIHHDWHEFVIDDAKEVGKILGIKISRVYYSGFWSQGDGACFEGHFQYSANTAKLIQQYAPLDTELHAIARGLQAVYRRNFYKAYGSVKQRGHYMHSHCTTFSISDATEEQEDDLIELYRDFMNWIYSRLEKEYEYQISDESVRETIIANQYEFDEDGNLA
jgi:hypothetical protein